MTGAAQTLTVRVPLTVRKQRGGRKLMVAPGGMAPRGASAADTTLVKALARAFRWRRMMEAGRYGTINELAAAEKINSSYVSPLLRLTLLAPDIVDAILDRPPNVTDHPPRYSPDEYLVPAQARISAGPSRVSPEWPIQWDGQASIQSAENCALRFALEVRISCKWGSNQGKCRPR